MNTGPSRPPETQTMNPIRGALTETYVGVQFLEPNLLCMIWGKRSSVSVTYK